MWNVGLKEDLLLAKRMKPSYELWVCLLLYKHQEGELIHNLLVTASYLAELLFR